MTDRQRQAPVSAGARRKLSHLSRPAAKARVERDWCLVWQYLSFRYLPALRSQIALLRSNWRARG